MAPVVKGSRFERDFEAAAIYLSQRNVSAALRFVDAVEHAIAMLSVHPEIGPLWRSGEPAKPTRYMLVPGFHNYLIFYRFEQNEVRLGRLLHAARDIQEPIDEA